jgi:hypothetical protein
MQPSDHHFEVQAPACAENGERRPDFEELSSVIEYIEDDEEMLRQCAQPLAAGGHLLASFSNRRSARTVVRRDVRAGTVVIGNPGGGIGTTEQHTDRHRPALQHRPCYPAAAGGKSAGHDVRRIVAELEHGRGYVE